MLDTKSAASLPNYPHDKLVSISPSVSQPSVARVTSQELMQHARELEIDHHGKIYRLRITQLNKLILTA